jgi:hypothetical protein
MQDGQDEEVEMRDERAGDQGIDGPGNLSQDETEGHARVVEPGNDADGQVLPPATVAASDSAWLRDALRADSGVARMRVLADDDDVEGHIATPTVRVKVEADDVAGHALNIHFPSTADADAFRRRLLTAGVLVATVALAAPGAAAAVTFVDPASGILDALVQPTEETDRGEEGVGVLRVR